MHKLANSRNKAVLSHLVIVAASMSACGAPVRDGSTTARAEGADAEGRRISAAYLKQHGGALDACFGPPPAIVGPGAIQTLADDPGRKATAINRLVIAIDASGSMAARIGRETKMDAAKRAAIAFLHTVPANTQVGLVAFGHRGSNLPQGKAESCRGVENVYPLGSADPAQVEAALGRVKATGWTPLAAAITTAGQSFTPDQASGAQVVYVVSDGLETCGGDPVAAARALSQGPVKAVVNIIGFDLSHADRTQLSAVAAAGGGAFVEARSGGDIGAAMDQVWRKVRAASAMTTEYTDAARRSTANNIAVARYTSDLNYCFARTTSAETTGLQAALDAAAVTAAGREAALARLRVRHRRYGDRNQQVAANLLAQVKTAAGAISAQQRSSETRLGVKP